jgi:hypothetical protein
MGRLLKALIRFRVNLGLMLVPGAQLYVLKRIRIYHILYFFALIEVYSLIRAPYNRRVVINRWREQ